MRIVFAVIAGYVSTAVVVMATLTLASTVLGQERIFREGTLEVTWTWLVVSSVLSFIAAVLGGWLAAQIGRTGSAVVVLAGLMLVLGLALAVYQARNPPPEPPGSIAELERQEMGRYARQPPWYPWVIPLVGVAGVVIGGRIRLLAAEIQAEEG